MKPMANAELHYLGLIEISAMLAARELSPVEVATALLHRIANVDKHLHSYAHVMTDTALAQAKRAEAEIVSGQYRGPLHGIPIAVKDLCFTKGISTASGTRLFADWRPSYSATVVERLEKAGAILLGKLQMTEGASAEHHPQIKAPLNPWDKTRWPGASSSGAGVATAAGLCYGSIASDTGGSIRFPAAANGVTGIKPTWGRVSRHGIFPLMQSLDHVGPMARSVEDAAAILGVIAGADSKDPTALKVPVPDYLAELKGEAGGIRIGVDRSFNTDDVDGPVVEAVDGAVEVLRKLGAEIREIAFPPTRDLAVGWLPFAAVGAALAHEQTYPGRAQEYGPSLRELIEAGHAVSGIDMARTLLARETFAGRLAAVFEQIDLIAIPAMYIEVPTLRQMAALGEDPETPAKLLRFTAPTDFSGNPTVTLPCGFDGNGLPVGFQLVGRHLGETVLCRAAHAYQGATNWHLRHPTA
jgi:amidase